MALTLISGAAAAEPGVSLKLAQQRAQSLSALEYQLELQVPGERSAPIEGKMTIRFHYRADGQSLQIDFRQTPEHLLTVSVNGQPVDYQQTQEHILLPANSLRSGANKVVLAFLAGDGSLNRNEDYLYTLFVPDRARTAFPLFDQPDLKSRISLSLVLPPGWTALANAALLQKEQQGSNLRWTFAPTEPISSYLFAFVAGDFATQTREVNGRSMTMLHRETDTAKVARNLDAIFDLHGQALSWMEAYTGISLPFSKLDFALIPSFQYGGMEHTGAIGYRASSLLLEAEPTQVQLLSRASLIAHEVAHMWFGNLVTMAWFNDVWTKEVFANFMAAKIVNPAFPQINHDLNFLVRHYPGAYSVDRTAGANPIRQDLANLNLAGQLYGPIIYQKAPIMMRQLERVLGEAKFRKGMRQYLSTHAYGNATWPELVDILDALSDTDLKTWSEVWVNTPGRPQFTTARRGEKLEILQTDPADKGRVWTQHFTVRPLSGGSLPIASTAHSTALTTSTAAGSLLLNADGRGYGLFPASLAQLDIWQDLTLLERGSSLVNIYENVLEGRIKPASYLRQLLPLIRTESEPLILDLALAQLYRIHTSLLTEATRKQSLADIESALWDTIELSLENRRQLYESYSAIAQSPPAMTHLKALWTGELKLQGLTLSERDRIRLAEILAIRLPAEAAAIIATQLQNTRNPDDLRRLQFIAPSLSPDARTRDAFFASLAQESNRQTENWVLDGLRNLHHPSRTGHSVRYLGESLALLEEIQVTGDIFFPGHWLNASLANHNSDQAVQTVTGFLHQRPDYNPQLRMKILQAADLPIRANRILAAPP
jgi:aminopeptidase N